MFEGGFSTCALQNEYAFVDNSSRQYWLIANFKLSLVDVVIATGNVVIGLAAKKQSVLWRISFECIHIFINLQIILHNRLTHAFTYKYLIYN